AEEREPCFVISRVSTTDEQQETSFAQQMDEGPRYAAKHGLHVAHHFQMRETASKDAQRKEFKLVLRLLDSDVFAVRHLVVKNVERLMRSLVDKVELDRLRHTRGVHIYYYGSGKILAPDADESAEMMDDMEVLFAKDFSRRLSGKIK